MAKKTKRDTVKVVTGVCRLSFPHLREKYSFDAGDPVYMATFLIPKSDKKTIGKFEDAYDELYRKYKREVFQNIPLDDEDIWKPLRDGDRQLRKKPELVGYEKHLFFTAKSPQSQPKFFDEDGEDLYDLDELYAGSYVRCAINIYCFNNAGNIGFGAFLESVKKIKDGERFGDSSRASASDYDEEDADYEPRSTRKTAPKVPTKKKQYRAPYEDEDDDLPY